MKIWEILAKADLSNSNTKIIDQLLTNRGITIQKDRNSFLSPPRATGLQAKDVSIDGSELGRATTRIKKAIEKGESIVVYSDYDADGITAGAVMWETIHKLGGNVMPYVPHRVEEGYGLSVKGIDAVQTEYHPGLIITVDHGITGHEKVAYAKSLGIDVIVTDHHVKPEILPDCIIVHTTRLSGAGISWFVACHLAAAFGKTSEVDMFDLLGLAAMGTIADMVPLTGPNRSIAKYGLEALNATTRVGIVALLTEAGLMQGSLSTYDVSHILAPRLNAMGRLVHAKDALRLLCTNSSEKATELAALLGTTNKERQQLTIDTTLHAHGSLVSSLQGKALLKKLIFIHDKNYNQGIIGLVAGKLVEEYYRPTIVVAQGEEISKASARSISGFNIVEAIRSCSDILIDVGGHPMAAGFTVETKHLTLLQQRLEDIAERELSVDMLSRVLKIDIELPLVSAQEALWQSLRSFEPFGFGNSEPIFCSRAVEVKEARLVGAEGKHLKLRLKVPASGIIVDAIAFKMGELYGKLQGNAACDIAYTLDMNVWNGTSKLQLKVKDIHPLE